MSTGVNRQTCSLSVRLKVTKSRPVRRIWRTLDQTQYLWPSLSLHKYWTCFNCAVKCRQNSIDLIWISLYSLDLPLSFPIQSEVLYRELSVVLFLFICALGIFFLLPLSPSYLLSSLLSFYFLFWFSFSFFSLILFSKSFSLHFKAAPMQLQDSLARDLRQGTWRGCDWIMGPMVVMLSESYCWSE